MQLEKDMQFKEEQITRIQEANAAQAAKISSLNDENKQHMHAISNLQLRLSSA